MALENIQRNTYCALLITWVVTKIISLGKRQLEKHILCTRLGLSPKLPHGEKHLEKDILCPCDHMGCNQNNHTGEKHQLENHILCTLLGLSPKPPQAEKHLEKHILRAFDHMGCNQNNHMGQKHQLENHKLCTLLITWVVTKTTTW
jgi:hypothetical protein